MRTNSMLIQLAPWVVVALFPGVDLAAQTGVHEGMPRWQAQCLAAVSALESRRSSDEVIGSLQTLSNCERSAGDGLRNFWGARPDARGEVQALATASRQVRDRRIMHAVIGTVRDRTASGELRMAALIVLAAYIDPYIGGIREHPGIFEGYTIVTTFHPGQVDGSVPLDDSDIQTILNTLVEIAGGGASDARISGAAAYLKSVVEYVLARRGPGGR